MFENYYGTKETFEINSMFFQLVTLDRRQKIIDRSLKATNHRKLVVAALIKILIKSRDVGQTSKEASSFSQRKISRAKLIRSSPR